ncbi:hypothetical protein EYF80_067218 [Liparis tanakae]|uniref:Uncharacterized protein n=1 Tax=Liparis tanakae TaxID=230148 RepID=A0A4Z2E1C4_9TELE|nr:hypothetical protein EYF80_067218 [Liparis tanakae]
MEASIRAASIRSASIRSASIRAASIRSASITALLLWLSRVSQCAANTRQGLINTVTWRRPEDHLLEA